MDNEISERPDAPAAGLPAETSTGVDDFDTLLNAYDEQVNGSQSRQTPSTSELEAQPPSGEATQVPDVPANSAGDHTQQRFRELIDSGAFDPRNARLSQLEKFAGEATAFIRSQQEAQWAAIEKSEAEAVFEEAEKRLSGFQHARIDGRAWLRNELTINAELSSAWANRYTSDDAMRQARVAVDRALGKLERHAMREEERIAAIPYVEDREAVTQAVRGAARGAPVAKPVDVSKLSDDELKAHTKERYGFVPSF